VPDARFFVQKKAGLYMEQLDPVAVFHGFVYKPFKSSFVFSFFLLFFFIFLIINNSRIAAASSQVRL
jgi:hypothetical protein